jgi:hypothetical protein
MIMMSCGICTRARMVDVCWSVELSLESEVLMSYLRQPASVWVLLMCALVLPFYVVTAVSAAVPRWPNCATFPLRLQC